MSTNSFASIHVQLTRGLIASGDQVNGMVMLCVFNAYQAQGVSVRIRGVERAKVVQVIQRSAPQGQPRPAPEYHDKMEEAVICDQSVNVFQSQGGMILPGQYAFPFSFSTGANWPSTFSHDYREHGRDCYGKIDYTVTATIAGGAGSAPTFSTPIILNDTLPADQINGAMKDTTTEVTHCCCFGKGKVLLRSHFEKSQYSIGETATYFTEIDNSQCTSDIVNIHATFRQLLIITAQGTSETISKDIQSFNSGKIPAGEARKGPQAVMSKVPIQSQDGTPLPATANTGRLIKNSYTINSIMSMDATQCCDQPPQTSMAIQVISPDVAPQPWAQMPPNWNPQQMPPTNFQVQLDQQYANQTFTPSPMMAQR